MDYRSAFAISASGMTVEKARLDVTASNIANLHTVRKADGSPYRPLQVTSTESINRFAVDFGRMAGEPVVGGSPGGSLSGAQVLRVEETGGAPRKRYEPASPDADAQGYVLLPGVNLVTEMVTMTSALRAYEANVVALNAAKTMALKALELGGAS